MFIVKFLHYTGDILYFEVSFASLNVLISLSWPVFSLKTMYFKTSLDSIKLLFERTMIRSIEFFNSLIFPTHSFSTSNLIAAWEYLISFLPISLDSIDEKYSMSPGISSRRSRNGRNLYRYYIQSIKQIFSEVAKLHLFLKILVSRTYQPLKLVLIVLLPPTLSNSFSWRTLNNLTCIDGDISPISSRNKVPLFALSNLPIFSEKAPVKHYFLVTEQFTFQQRFW